ARIMFCHTVRPRSPHFPPGSTCRHWPARPSSRLTDKAGGVRGRTSRPAATALMLATSAPIASRGLTRAEAGLARGDEVLQRRGGRDIDDAVDPLRAEMALERCHGVARGAIEIAAGGDVIAISCQQRLHLF